MCAGRIKWHQYWTSNLEDEGGNTGSHGGEAHAVLDGSASVGEHG